MATHLIGMEKRTVCGLKITKRRLTIGDIVAKDATCQRCVPPPTTVYTDPLDLAVFIYRDKKVVKFLLDCRTTEGLLAKVFFNSKSKKKRHIILVQENGAWRLKRENEEIINPEEKDASSEGPGAVAKYLGAISNNETQTVLAGAAGGSSEAPDVRGGGSDAGTVLAPSTNQAGAD